jgi:hypothetical protein
MDIRIECPCGQTYKFSVEPVNDLMPCPVACPACGADGTQLANQFIRSAVAPAGIPIPPPVTSASGLRINRADTSDSGAAANPVPPAPPVPAFTRTYQPPKPLSQTKPNFALGILGGVLGGGVGMLGWYFLTMATDREFGMAAWFVGVLSGLGVRILARDGSPGLAYVAALCAALGILGGQFLVTNTIVNRVLGTMTAGADSAYDEEVNQAREGLKLQTDAEIKAWLQTNSETGAPVTSQDMDDFRKVQQPKMQDLVNGKPSRAEFTAKFTGPLSSFSMRYNIFKESVGFFTLLWIIFGVLSAWRIASG